MPIKKKVVKRKPAAKKKAPVKKRTGGIAAYVKKIQNDPAVKSINTKVKYYEKLLKGIKKKKAAAVKIARKKMK